MKNSNHAYPYYEHKKINNLRDLLTERYKQCPNQTAFSFRENNTVNRKTFKDVYEEVSALSNYFYTKYKNKHIALIGENSYNWVICFWAITISGNVCVAIDKDADKKLLTKLLKTSDTKVVYYSEKYCPFIKDMNVKSFSIDNLSEYIDFGKEKQNKYTMDNDNDAMIFFTSGTTGPNKGVVLSNKNIMADIMSSTSLYHTTSEHPTVALLPFHHAFGLVTAILMPFFYKKETFINTSLKNVLKDLKEMKPDAIFLVPAFVETFYKQIWKTVKSQKKEKLFKISIFISNLLLKVNIDIRKKLFASILNEFGGCLNDIICGGAYLDKKYVKWFRSIGINILNGYGITECSPVVSVNRNHHFKDGSIGQIGKWEKVKIIDGEICVKGENVMKGYYNDPDATLEVIKRGYFHTGDLGYIDEEGFLFITGRKKNLIILSNGENISPEAIEEELMKDKGICEIVVYSKNNKLVAAIYPQDDFMNNQDYFDNLIHKYNENKGKNKQVASVELRNTEFIKNNNRKILRNKVYEGE